MNYSKNQVGWVYKRYDAVETVSDAELMQELAGALSGAIAFAGFLVLLVFFL